MTRQTDATDLGAVLGIANAFVIAIGLSTTLEPGGTWINATIMVFAVALVPSMLVGFILGSIAERTHDHRRWIRLLVLALPALATVFALASVFSLTAYFARAAIPTLVATLLLERYTRAKPALPMGIVHRA